MAIFEERPSFGIYFITKGSAGGYNADTKDAIYLHENEVFEKLTMKHILLHVLTHACADKVHNKRCDPKTKAFMEAISLDISERHREHGILGV